MCSALAVIVLKLLDTAEGLAKVLEILLGLLN